MSATPPPTRRLAVAIGAAVAATTIAVGVTAGSLLGWFGPAAVPATGAPTEPAITPSPVIYVPIVPEMAPRADERAAGNLQLALHQQDREEEEDEGDEEHDEDSDD